MLTNSNETPTLPERHAVLVLAAGESTRLGQPKQLLTKQGVPLVRYIVGEALKTHPLQVLVVVGAQALGTGSGAIVKESASASASAVRDALDGLPITFAVNPAPSRGMASSLQIGAAALHKHHNRVLILCIDQPQLTLSHLERLMAEGLAHPDDEIVSSYAETIGMPVLIHSDVLARSFELTGDLGLKGLLQAHPEKLICVSFPELGFDVDNDDDLKIAQKEGWIE
ncbi:MAG: nucleotidyltransferase family protein [Candidatus Saccharibacteria bacterium]|nr:nucleotidyltransferase family protein [Moraxellaceae bacterium]